MNGTNGANRIGAGEFRSRFENCDYQPGADHLYSDPVEFDVVEYGSERRYGPLRFEEALERVKKNKLLFIEPHQSSS